MMSKDEKRMSELLEIEEKFKRSQETAKRARLKREARIRLERQAYQEAVEGGLIEAVTDAEVEAEMKS